MTPAPRASRPMPNVQGVGGGYARAADIVSADANRVGAGDAALAEGIGAAGAIIQAEEQRINAQHEAAYRARDLGTYSKLATDELNRISTEEDLSSLDTTKKYGKWLTENFHKVVNDHPGSPESKTALAARLESVRSTLATQAGQLGVKAQQKLVDGTISSQVNDLASRVYDNPGSLVEAWQSVDGIVDDFGAAITPDQELAYISKSRRELALAAVNSFMDRGAYTEARGIIETTPGLRAVMTGDDYTKMQGRIAAAERSDRDEATKGLRERQQLEQFLGRETTLAERVEHKFGKKDKTLEETISEYKNVLKRDLNQAELMDVLKINPRQASTAAGKAVQDRQMFIDQYGENSPQVQAFDEANLSNPASLSEVSGVRKEFTTQSKDFVVVRDSFNKIATLQKEDTPAGDMSLIFSFMKMLDPASTVREGEYASAQNTTGVPGRIVNLYNKALEGTFLTPGQRTEFFDAAEKLFQTQIKAQLDLEKQYTGIANRSKMTPEDVIVDYVGTFRQAAPKDGAARASGGTGAATAAPRFKYGLDGKRIDDGASKAGTL